MFVTQPVRFGRINVRSLNPEHRVPGDSGRSCLIEFEIAPEPGMEKGGDTTYKAQLRCYQPLATADNRFRLLVANNHDTFHCSRVTPNEALEPLDSGQANLYRELVKAVPIQTSIREFLLSGLSRYASRCFGNKT